MKNLNRFFLLAILVLAIFMRFYRIDSIPPSASLDEASLGWNAYSILQTGKDEYGEKLPLILRAYDDWRPALYVYFIVPFVKFLDLNIAAVRLPSVMFSVLTVLATYYLVRELFKKEHIALVSAFLLAISPWHIYISRLGHEANLGLASGIFAILFFLKKRIYLSALFFVISLVSYQTEKIFIPVLLLGMLFIYKEELLKMKKKVFIAVLFSILFLTPFINATLQPQALIRFKATNVFESYPSRFDERAILLKKAVDDKNILGLVIYNRRVLAAQIFAEGYLSHFNPFWLFTNAHEDRHKVPGLGLLYIWTFPFILIGVYVLIRKNFDPKTKKLIFIWFLSSPLAAALTTDAPHAMRSIVFLPTWQIFASLGLVYFYSVIKLKKISVGLFSIIILLSLAYFYRQYFLVFPKTQSDSFQFALSKTISYVLKNEDSYDKIVFSNKNNLYQSYMFYLFYTKYDPKKYLKEGRTKSGGFEETHKFSNLEFRPIETEKEESGSLLVGNIKDFEDQKNLKELSVIKNLNGKAMIKVVYK